MPEQDAPSPPWLRGIAWTSLLDVHEKQLKDNANRARIEPLSRRAVPLIEDYDAVPMGSVSPQSNYSDALDSDVTELRQVLNFPYANQATEQDNEKSDRDCPHFNSRVDDEKPVANPYALTTRPPCRQHLASSLEFREKYEISICTII